MTEEAPEVTEVDGDTKPDDKPTEEKVELDPAALKAELARARKEAANYRVDAQRWRAHEDSQRTEAEKAEAARKEAESKLAALELRATRAEVAAAHQIPPDLVPLLAGATKEEMDASAAALKKHIRNGAAPDLKPGVRGRSVGSKGSSVDDFIRGSLRR